MLLDSQFHWSMDWMMALDLLMSRLRQAPRTALVFCANYVLPLLHVLSTKLLKLMGNEGDT